MLRRIPLRRRIFPIWPESIPGGRLTIPPSDLATMIEINAYRGRAPRAESNEIVVSVGDGREVVLTMTRDDGPATVEASGVLRPFAGA